MNCSGQPPGFYTTARRPLDGAKTWQHYQLQLCIAAISMGVKRCIGFDARRRAAGAGRTATGLTWTSVLWKRRAAGTIDRRRTTDSLPYLQARVRGVDG